MSQPAGAAPNRRVTLYKNPNFTRNAVSAYGKALRKFSIKPTLPGPFDTIELATQPAPAAASASSRPLRPARKLVKKDADGKTADITATDINGDNEYIAQVEIGTPPQQMDVIFDTGSADF